MSKLLLKLVMLFSGLWRALGADVTQLKAILQTKLMLDDRKPISFGMNKGAQHKKKKDRKNSITITMLLSLFMGILYVAPILMAAEDAIIGLTMFYSIFMFFATFTLLTDFANIIVDTQDKYILFPRPVNDRTVMLSRLLYISIYLFRMVIPMSVLPWVCFGFIKGWVGAVWFIFPLILCTFIVLFLICGLYFLMIRIAGAGKFKDVLNYFQIIFSIAFFMVWMFSSRMIDEEAFANLDLKMFEWVKFLPSYWLAITWSWLDNTAKVIPGTGWTSILAFIFPIVSLWATIKWLAPQFIKSLVASDNIEQVKVSNKKVETQGSPKQPLYMQLAHRFNKDDTAKAGFIITWLQTARSRTFKMRVLPAIAYVPAYFFYILMSRNKEFSQVWAELPEGRTYIMLLYMTFFVVMNALTYITMSEQYKAAWVYYPTPVKEPGQVILGSFRAVWAKYFLPFMIVIGLFVLNVWGLPALFDVILATVNITLFSMVMLYINYRYLPFSRKEQVKDSAGKTIIRIIATFLLIGILGVGHYAVSGIAAPQKGKLSIDLSAFVSSNMLTTISYLLKTVFIILSSIFLWLIQDGVRHTSWTYIRKQESEF